jgi:Gpi18-like mannosyltransferase
MFVKKLFDENIAFISSLFFLAFPTSFYTGLVYTESLFLMLAILFLYFLYQRDLFPALITAFLLPLARAQGILIICPLIIFIFLQNFEKGKFRFRFTREYLLLLGFATGFISYLCFMNYFTGSYFTGFVTQQKYYIAHYSILNLMDPIGWFMNNFVNISLTLHGYKTSIIDRLFFIGFLALLYPAYKKLDKTLFFYMLALGLFPAILGSMMAYTRYVFEAFPMFIVMALLFKEKHYYATIPMIVLQTIFVLRQALNYWVS